MTPWVDYTAELTLAGQYRVASVPEAFQARFFRALRTAPGELRVRPAWGIGAAQALYQPITRALIDELTHRIRRYLDADPDVDRIARITVVADKLGRLAALHVSVTVDIRGQSFTADTRLTR